VSNHILHPDHGLGNRKLSQLTARSVGEFRDQLRGAGVKIATTRKILATLHSALAYAIAQDWIATNAAHGIRADEEFRIKLTFAACTGVRAGEQWAARWRDIDLETGQLHICRRVDAYREEGPPKSVAGVRTVPLSSQLTTMLKKWRMKSSFKTLDDLVFPNEVGTYISHDNLVKRRFNPLFEPEAARTTDPACRPQPLRRFNWHALRHFAVSTWIEARFPPKTVQTFAGHASLQVTMDRYGHLFPSEDHKKAMDEIAKGLFA
jgi:integrase